MPNQRSLRSLLLACSLSPGVLLGGQKPGRPSPVTSAEQLELPELASQAKVFSIRLEPREDESWVEDCLNLSLDQKLFGCQIIAYRIKWFSGAWSGWFAPGVNDLYKKPGEPLRRYWACFNDHAFEIIYQAPKEPVAFTGVLKSPDLDPGVHAHASR